MPRRYESELEDFLPDQPSPILGQQRAVDSGRRYRTLAEVLFQTLKFAFLLMLLSVAGVFYYLMREALLHDPRFALAVREVRGLRHVSEGQVLMKVKNYEGESQPLYAFDLNGLRESIEKISWIKEAAVRRNFPDRLMIEVVERTPIAFVRLDRGTLLVDDEGVFLESTLGEASHLDLPVLQGMEEPSNAEALDRNRRRLLAFKALLKELDANGAGLSKDLSEVFLSRPEELSVILNDETVLVKLGNSAVQEKFRRYLAIGRTLKQQYPGLDTVDMRFQNQVVVSIAGNSQVVEQ
jgi:cell division protein FtsQ